MPELRWVHVVAFTVYSPKARRIPRVHLGTRLVRGARFFFSMGLALSGFPHSTPQPALVITITIYKNPNPNPNAPHRGIAISHLPACGFKRTSTSDFGFLMSLCGPIGMCI